LLLKSLAYARLSYFSAQMSSPLSKQTIEFCLLNSVSSVEEFLKLHFNCSASKLKKYFAKSFLNKAMPAHSILDLPLNFVNDGLINPNYCGPDINIIFEDEKFLVMDKPANLFVHPLTYDEGNNCLSFLRQKHSQLLEINKNNYDRGLLYRLDFETSGVLVYVKDENDYLFLRKNFQEVAKKKSYICAVSGECKLNNTYRHYFTSSQAKGSKVLVSSLATKGEVGELSVSALSYNAQTNITLLRVELKSGLRHQIRAQLAYLGFPLCGDLLYGGARAPRLYLHAQLYELAFHNFTYRFESNPHNFNAL